jgi:3',5'-cyclic AMP phosphodiesterase CpdA
MLIAQLTDSHVRPAGALFADVVDTQAMLGNAVDTVLALSPRPDAVIFTGDLTNDGEPEAYATLRPILERLPMPVYAIPGNHDDREAMLALDGVAEVGAGSAFRQYAVDLGDLRLIALDSNVPGKAHGALCAERLGWLEAELGQGSDQPVLMMVHHPPAETGIAFMDRIPLTSDPALEAIIRQHAARIQRIVCGHVHRAIFYRWQNVPVSIAPGVAHHVILGLDDQEPTFVMEPPGFHLHHWSTERGLVTHHVPIGSYPGPYQFSGNPGARPYQPGV